MSSADGVAPGTLTTRGAVPPTSVSASSSAAQLVGVKESAVWPLATREGGKRKMVSPSCQAGGAVKVLDWFSVFPVAKNSDRPSEEIPPGAHTPPANARVTHALTWLGSLVDTPTIQPW